MTETSRGEETQEDSVILRFQGQDHDGTELHELRASHVAEVLEGLVGLSSDFDKAGAFGQGPPGEVLVRPAREGSFIIEVVRLVHEYPKETAETLGLPTLSQVLYWSTKSLRASPKDYERQPNGMVKINWSDDTVDEVPAAAWDELNKRRTRRKRHLRKIMAPLSDDRVSLVQVSDPAPQQPLTEEQPPATFVLERPDYNAANPEPEIEESQDFFEVEAQMSAIDFDSPERWRVKTATENRTATVEDQDFLSRVELGLALHKDDVFNLSIREDSVTKDGRTRRTWTVLRVLGHRRGRLSGDVDS